MPSLPQKVKLPDCRSRPALNVSSALNAGTAIAGKSLQYEPITLELQAGEVKQHVVWHSDVVRWCPSLGAHTTIVLLSRSEAAPDLGHLGRRVVHDLVVARALNWREI